MSKPVGGRKSFDRSIWRLWTLYLFFDNRIVRKRNVDGGSLAADLFRVVILLGFGFGEFANETSAEHVFETHHYDAL